MRLTMMSYTMSRQPQYFDLLAMLEQTQELGLSGVDFVTLHGRTAAELRRLADDHGVPVVCYTFVAGALGSPDEAEQTRGVEESRRGLEAAATLGAPVVMIVPAPRQGMPRDEGRRHWARGLARVMPYAREAGIALTVENFPGVESPFVTAADFLEAERLAPGLKLTFDHGNASSGEDVAESFRRSAPYVVHAHFKDWTIRDAEAPGFRRMLDGRWYKPALIGEGDVDHRRCLAAMQEAGYSGCINIEYEGNEYRPAEAVGRAVDYLRSLGA